MLHPRHYLAPLLVLAAFLSGPIRADEAEPTEPRPPSVRNDESGDEDDGPPSTFAFAEFKKAVAKVQLPGFQRMPEISAEGDHGLILAGPDDTGLMIMAQRAGIGERFEKLAADKLTRFKHKGHDAFFAQLTDPEGEEMAFIIVKYPEHRMGLFISGKPVRPRGELMKLLGQVEM